MVHDFSILLVHCSDVCSLVCYRDPFFAPARVITVVIVHLFVFHFFSLICVELGLSITCCLFSGSTYFLFGKFSPVFICAVPITLLQFSFY